MILPSQNSLSISDRNFHTRNNFAQWTPCNTDRLAARAYGILSGRPCTHPRIKAIRLLITRGRRALANLSVGRKRASAVSLAACVTIGKQETPLLPSPSSHPSPDSMQSMSSGGGDGATSARINPALRRIFFIPVLFPPSLFLRPSSRARLPFRFREQADTLPRRTLSLSFLCSFFSLSFTWKGAASPASNTAENALRGKVGPSRQLHSRRSSFSLLDSDAGERMNSTGF